MIEKLQQDVVKTVMEIFESMIFIEVKAGESLRDEPLPFSSALTSIIGLAGDIRGMIAIHCSEEAAKGITGAMLGTEVAVLDEDVKDAVGEIANMTAGGFKLTLAELGRNIKLAIPTTAIGKSLRTSGLVGTSNFVIPFQLPTGAFAVEVKLLDS